MKIENIFIWLNAVFLQLFFLNREPISSFVLAVFENRRPPFFLQAKPTTSSFSVYFTCNETGAVAFGVEENAFFCRVFILKWKAHSFMPFKTF